MCTVEVVSSFLGRELWFWFLFSLVLFFRRLPSRLLAEFERSAKDWVRDIAWWVGLVLLELLLVGDIPGFCAGPRTAAGYSGTVVLRPSLAGGVLTYRPIFVLSF